jgi:hypothetical protein
MNVEDCVASLNGNGSYGVEFTFEDAKGIRPRGSAGASAAFECVDELHEIHDGTAGGFRMGIRNELRIMVVRAFRFAEEHSDDSARTVAAECETIVSCSPEDRRDGDAGLALLLQLLECNDVRVEEVGRYLPVVVAGSAERFGQEASDDFSEVPLKRDRGQAVRIDMKRRWQRRRRARRVK